MKYGARQDITKEELEAHKGDIENHIRDCIFMNIGREMGKNDNFVLKKTETFDPSMYGSERVIFEGQVIAFSENQFNRLMGEIVSVIYDPAVEMKVRSIIKKVGANPSKAGKKYI